MPPAGVSKLSKFIRLPLLLFALLGLLVLSGCVNAPPTTAPATPTLLPTAGPTATAAPTPDIEATVTARLQAALAAMPTPTPWPTPVLTPTATPTPTPTPPPTFTPQPTWTPAPTWTPVPTNTPIPMATAAPTLTPIPTPAILKQTIIFADLNWNSALIQNRIAQFIVEKGYGYPTDVAFGNTSDLFRDLRWGLVNVSMEIWLPNQGELWAEAEQSGEVISLGESLDGDWQSAFVIPAYLQEQYPGLDHVDDLKNPRYKSLFATSTSKGKAQLVSCVSGWACAEINAAQVKAYGLNDHVEIVNPWNGSDLNDSLFSAYEKREPWLGYQWGTNNPPLLLDLVRLEEPAYSDYCWRTNKACAYQDAVVIIGVNADLPDKAPEVADMLVKWDFSRDLVLRPITRWLAENPQADEKDAALWWLSNNSHIWREWVTTEAAIGIRIALAAGEAADGWP